MTKIYLQNILTSMLILYLISKGIKITCKPAFNDLSRTISNLKIQKKSRLNNGIYLAKLLPPKISLPVLRYLSTENGEWIGASPKGKLIYFWRMKTVLEDEYLKLDI